MLQNRGNQIQELLCATMWMRAAPSCILTLTKAFRPMETSSLVSVPSSFTR